MRTTSNIEYHFVVEPSRGLATLGLDTWPVEAGLRGGDAHRRREAQPLASFDAERLRIDADLDAHDCSPLMLVEFVSARLYTGPMVAAGLELTQPRALIACVSPA